MTAKERLRALVEGLDEDQARAWFGEIELAEDSHLRVQTEALRAQPMVRQRMNREAALALLKKWRAEPPVMTESQWDEFAAAIDEGREERPLFH